MKKLWTALLLSVALTGTFASTAEAVDTINIRLNWYLGGSHGAFILGRDLGYFTQEGIDIVVDEGRGSARGVQLVGTGADDFAMADASSLMAGVSKGLEVRSVMSLINVSAFAIVALKASGINSVQDLKGKTVAATAGDGPTQLWPAILAANGLKDGDVRLVMMDASAKPVSVMERQTNALLGGITDQPNVMKGRGFEVSVLPYSDIGVKQVGVVIVTHPNTIAKKPDMVRRFVKATQRSYEAMRSNPAAAVAALKKEKADLNEATLLAQINDTLTLIAQGQPAGKPLGFGPPETWQQTLELGTTFQALKTEKRATDFYTNEFVGQ